MRELINYVNLLFRTKLVKSVKISEISSFLPIILYNGDCLISCSFEINNNNG